MPRKNCGGPPGKWKKTGSNWNKDSCPTIPKGALEKLDEAQEKLDKSRDNAEEELLREQLAKAADLLRALRERQQSACDEEKRLHAKVIVDGQWKLSVPANPCPD